MASSAYLVGSFFVFAGHALAGGHHHHLQFHQHRHPDHVTQPAHLVARAAVPTDVPSADGLAEGCNNVNQAILDCAKVIPNFENADIEWVGQCLCCDGKKFQPEEFNGNAASCASYIEDIAPQSTSAINGTYDQ